jgi:hypothetical protein
MKQALPSLQPEVCKEAITEISCLHQHIPSAHFDKQKLLYIVLEAQEKSQQHHYALTNAHTREAPLIELGIQIKPTSGSTTLTKVEKFCKDMKELLEIFYEINSKFQNFIAKLMKKVSPIASIAP